MELKKRDKFFNLALKNVYELMKNNDVLQHLQQVKYSD